MEAAGTCVQQQLQAGFDAVHAVLVQRAGALLAQVTMNSSGSHMIP